MLRNGIVFRKLAVCDYDDKNKMLMTTSNDMTRDLNQTVVHNGLINKHI